ncbi:MAG: hypothetical protein HY961_20935 [Ignavibacteriae bacterium]|nr:hypothetical protein [Ignavibacteriota bacterium]
MAEQTPDKKAWWEKASVLLQSSSGLITAITVAIIGMIGTNYLKERELAETQSRERLQAAETNVRIYTELMSKREEAESALRKDMFVSIIQSFLRPASASLDEKVLNIELLSYNFHESLNLKPLFVYLEKEISRSKDSERGDYLDRLHKVAVEITRKQMLVLESAGQKVDRIVDFEALRNTPGGIPIDGATLTVDSIQREFSLVVIEADAKTKEMKLRLEIRTPMDSARVETNSAEFWVGFYDFPMIDNTRLSNDQRCSVVINAFDTESADITLAYFPGSYASLKEKPYYQEVVQKLMKTNATFGAGSK